MKNINEVIKALEESRVQTETGTGYWVGFRDNDDLKADAIHYLKEYHDIKATMDWHEEMEVIRDGIVNSPLTWDELKEMNGKPVWVEEKYSFCDEWHGMWEVIRSIWDNEYEYDPFLAMTDDEFRYRDDMGERWLAYLKERK